jgi:hypothetical protein
MFLVRNVFQAKPGRAKDLVQKFKAAAPHLETRGVRNTRILTDVVETFWTVVIESEVEDLGDYAAQSRTMSSDPKVGEVMKGYMDLVQGGRREVFLIE